MIVLCILVALVKSQEVPSNQLAPRNFNYHSNSIRQYLEEVSPTKKGPVLFPNDAPPPPRPPLVVTSRPLAESIARSELNNSIADSSYINPVTYRPTFGNYNNLGYTNQQPQYHTDVSSEQDYSEGQNYAFSYIVKDQKNGDDFSHKQQSVGSATNGEYRVRLPDGRLQIVSYTADDNGYKANVRYDEEPVHNPIHEPNYINNYNLRNDFNKPTPYKLNKLVNSNYDFGQFNYRDEIPVKENQYESKEYYDYSAENYKNAELYPVSTESPRVASQPNYQSTPAPYQQNAYTTTAPFLQNYHTSAAPLTFDSELFQVNPTASSSTVRPPYEEIKHLFTTPHYKNIEINSPSSYSADVVSIGNKHSYNFDLGLNSLVTSTPASYIASSLSSLNDRINSKPVLSNDYIDRINKYLRFK